MDPETDPQQPGTPPPASMTPAQLGQKVKAKYPGAYDDRADEEVGRAVAAKYPEYGSLIAPVLPTPVQSGTSIVKPVPPPTLIQRVKNYLAPDPSQPVGPGPLDDLANWGKRTFPNMSKPDTDPDFTYVTPGVDRAVVNTAHRAARTLTGTPAGLLDFFSGGGDPISANDPTTDLTLIPAAQRAKEAYDTAQTQGIGQATTDLAGDALALGATYGVTKLAGKVPGAVADTLNATGRGTKKAGSLVSRVTIGAPGPDDNFGADAGAGLSRNRIVAASPKSLLAKVKETTGPAVEARDAILARSPVGPNVDVTQGVNEPFNEVTARKVNPRTGATPPQNQARMVTTQRAINEVQDPQTGAPTGTPKPLSNLTPLEAAQLGRNVYDMTDYGPNADDAANQAVKGAAANIKDEILKASPESSTATENVHDLMGAQDTLKSQVNPNPGAAEPVHSFTQAIARGLRSARYLGGTSVGAGLDAAGSGLMDLSGAVRRAGSPVAPTPSPTTGVAPPPIPGTPPQLPAPGQGTANPPVNFPSRVIPPSNPATPQTIEGQAAVGVVTPPPTPPRGLLEQVTGEGMENTTGVAAPPHPGEPYAPGARTRVTPNPGTRLTQQVLEDAPGYVSPKGSRRLLAGPDGSVRPEPYPLPAPAPNAPSGLLESRTGMRAPSARPALMRQLRDELRNNAIGLSDEEVEKSRQRLALDPSTLPESGSKEWYNLPPELQDIAYKYSNRDSQEYQNFREPYLAGYDQGLNIDPDKVQEGDHSLIRPVDFYHGTKSTLLDRINNEGLVPGVSDLADNQEPGVYLSPDKNFASAFAHQRARNMTPWTGPDPIQGSPDPALLKVRMPRGSLLRKDADFIDENYGENNQGSTSVMSPHTIDPKSVLSQKILSHFQDEEELDKLSRRNYDKSTSKTAYRYKGPNTTGRGDDLPPTNMDPADVMKGHTSLIKDTDLYHGSPKDLSATGIKPKLPKDIKDTYRSFPDAHDSEGPKESWRGVYLSEDPEVANSYGGNVHKVTLPAQSVVRQDPFMSNPSVMTSEGIKPSLVQKLNDKEFADRSANYNKKPDGGEDLGPWTPAKTEPTVAPKTKRSLKAQLNMDPSLVEPGDMSPLEDQTFYHGTDASNLDSIRREGLRSERNIFLSRNEDVPKDYAQNVGPGQNDKVRDGAVLAVKAPYRGIKTIDEHPDDLQPKDFKKFPFLSQKSGEFETVNTPRVAPEQIDWDKSYVVKKDGSKVPLSQQVDQSDSITNTKRTLKSKLNIEPSKVLPGDMSTTEPTTLYHGTHRDLSQTGIESNIPDMVDENFDRGVAKKYKGVYFTSDPVDASHYGPQIHKVEVPPRTLIRQDPIDPQGRVVLGNINKDKIKQVSPFDYNRGTLAQQLAGSSPTNVPDVPSRLPDPGDIDGWEALVDEGKARYNVNTHAYEYTAAPQRKTLTEQTSSIPETPLHDRMDEMERESGAIRKDIGAGKYWGTDHSIELEKMRKQVEKVGDRPVPEGMNIHPKDVRTGEWSNITPFDAYHGTPTENVKSILKQGLKGTEVSLALDPNTAKSYANSQVGMTTPSSLMHVTVPPKSVIGTPDSPYSDAIMVRRPAPGSLQAKVLQEVVPKKTNTSRKTLTERTKSK